MQALAVRLDQGQPIKVMLVAQPSQMVVLRIQAAVAARMQSEQMELLVMAAQAVMALHHP
jgi:hypothetical protein